MNKGVQACYLPKRASSPEQVFSDDPSNCNVQGGK